VEKPSSDCTACARCSCDTSGAYMCVANSSSVVTPLLSLLSYTTGYVTLLVLASFKGMESLESIAGDEERNEGIMRVLGAGVVAVGGRMIMDGVLGDANLRGVGLL